MVLETLREIIADLGIEPEEVTPDAHLRGDLELDSTETVEISLELKRRLGAEVKLELKEDPTIADVCALVDEALTAVTGS
jgi:acyl carrier protein